MRTWKRHSGSFAKFAAIRRASLGLILIKVRVDYSCFVILYPMRHLDERLDHQNRNLRP
jgi:hypothetical protein